MIAGKLSELNYRKIVWLLPIVFMIHELEEWNIKGWYETNFVNPPEVSDAALRIMLLLISLIAFFITAIASSFKSEKLVAYISLIFFVAAAFSNAVQHLYWQVVWGGYGSGVISAALLVIPVTLLASFIAVRQGLVGRTFLSTLYVLPILMLYPVITAGNVVTPLMQNIHGFGEIIATLLGV